MITNLGLTYLRISFNGTSCYYVTIGSQRIDSMDNEYPPNALFVRSDLDDYGLDPYEFRLISHISRRGVCYAKLATIASFCKMSQRKAQDSLKILCKAGLLEKEVQGARKPAKYKVVHNSKLWKDKKLLSDIRKSVKYSE